MANKGDTRTQPKSPGAGWRLLSHKVVNGAVVNTWIYGGGGGGGGGGTSGGSSGGSSGGRSGGSGGSSGGESAEDKAKKRRQYIDAYNNYMDPTGKKRFNPPKRLLELAIKNDWSMATMYTWIRQNDPNYVNTAAYKGLLSNIKTLVKSILGPRFNISANKRLMVAVRNYAKLPPDKAKNETVIMQFFTKYIMPNKVFKKMYPAFAAWFRSPTSQTSGAFGGAKSPEEFIQRYTSAAALYRSAYKQDQIGVGDVNAEIPEALLITAMKNNWSTDGIEWLTAVRNTTAYTGSTGAQARAMEFDENWDKIFRGTIYDDVAPDSAMRTQYIKGSSDFTTFFNQVMSRVGTRTGNMIDAALPSYREFLENNPAVLSGQLDLFGAGGYFDRREAFIDMYRQMMDDPDAVPSGEILNRALAGAWSDAQWQLYVRENDVPYQDSPTATTRAEQLRKYWEALFGSNVPVDAEIERKWMVGETPSPDLLLSDIQELAIFKEQYPDYARFQQAQVREGAGTQVDPALYKQYSAAFDQAFADQGLNPEQFAMLKPIYFGSGISDDEFKNNITTWSQNREVFRITTGTEAQVQIASGLGTQAQGGEAAGASLRKRLQQEMEKYRAFTEGGQRAVAQTNTNTSGQIVQQI